MPTLELTDQQVVALMKQLPTDQKRMALPALAEDGALGLKSLPLQLRGGHFLSKEPKDE